VEDVKPPRLRRGDTIGVVAPASIVPADSLQRGVARLESLGYRVRYRDDLLSTDGPSPGRFAGSHERRAAEFRAMLDDPEVAAVFCARGGYGCNYLVDFLDSQPLPKPKIVMGYSDVTTLHAFFRKRAGWVTFHGPMVAVDFARGLDVLGPALESVEPWEVDTGGTQVLRGGSAEGTLLGGCLSLLVTTLGTRLETDWRGAILFLEDLGEAPYRVDRMLFHLREAGKFEGVRGVIFGEMKDCGEMDLLRTDLIRPFERLGIPVAAGMASGHTSGRNICLPFGVRARMEDSRLFILEGAVC
jgi:muramoyltetrapeptide carboxypeptidase